jgi:hypothetical protein
MGSIRVVPGGGEWQHTGELRLYSPGPLLLLGPWFSHPESRAESSAVAPDGAPCYLLPGCTLASRVDASGR